MIRYTTHKNSRQTLASMILCTNRGLETLIFDKGIDYSFHLSILISCSHCILIIIVCGQSLRQLYIIVYRLLHVMSVAIIH